MGLPVHAQRVVYRMCLVCCTAAVRHEIWCVAAWEGGSEDRVVSGHVLKAARHANPLTWRRRLAFAPQQRHPLPFTFLSPTSIHSTYHMLSFTSISCTVSVTMMALHPHCQPRLPQAGTSWSTAILVPGTDSARHAKGPSHLTPVEYSFSSTITEQRSKQERSLLLLKSNIVLSTSAGQYMEKLHEHEAVMPGTTTSRAGSSSLHLVSVRVKPWTVSRLKHMRRLYFNVSSKTSMWRQRTD